MTTTTESVPSFPPPPMSATLRKEQAKRKTSRTKSSSRVPKATALRRSRLFLLPFILVLSFTVLILAILYAYCVASKHTMLTEAQLASPSDVEVDGSIFGRREFVPNSLASLGPVPTGVDRRNAFPEPNGDNDAATADNIAEGVDTTSNDPTKTRQPSQSGSKSSLSAALVFYTLTSPLITILLVSVELILAMPFSPDSSSSSIASPVEEPRPRSRLSNILHSRRAHQVLLALTFLNVASMGTNAFFWSHCELPIPTITKNLAICPKEVRGHWMGGIHEVSIAKVTISWLVVVGLVCHTFFVWQNMRAERRRWASGESHGTAKEVDVTIEMEEGQLEEEKERRSRVRFMLSSGGW